MRKPGLVFESSRRIFRQGIGAQPRKFANKSAGLELENSDPDFKRYELNVGQVERRQIGQHLVPSAFQMGDRISPLGSTPKVCRNANYASQGVSQQRHPTSGCTNPFFKTRRILGRFTPHFCLDSYRISTISFFFAAC
jgi:hypothetical protein